ncbi:ATP-binding protein [candidate division WWE3 bacterium]|uniref:ATP-binding protein n=1 Tax=candidate division WWE3 bacterium TaxID=2053526 RepID=A0A955RPT9_UNCKA|nr:ATP-binding protein [candidate division WWE3 bacterium]
MPKSAQEKAAAEAQANGSKDQSQEEKDKIAAQNEEARKKAEQFAQGLLTIRDLISPSGMEHDFAYFRIGKTFYRTFFIAGYPREVGANWLSPLINFPHALDITMYYYPVDARQVLNNLRRKITEMETELNIEQQQGRILDPGVQLALQDARALQEELVAERERFFQFGLYITLPADSVEELDLIAKQLESVLGSVLLIPRAATLQMEDGFRSTLPYFQDTIQIYRNMDTTSIATTFPFTSSSLTSETGILYGINEHNASLIIFDRFSLANANMVVFAKSGAGKSYFVKLEALRSLMLGTEVIIIDPENEYKMMAEAIGGEYVALDFNSDSKINPFDLSQVYEEGEDELGLKILTLHSLLKVMLGEMNATEEAIIDRALIETYRLKGITQDPETQKLEPPLLEDLYKVLLGMEESDAKVLADRFQKYVVGSARGLFDSQTNVDIHNTFTVFGIRDLEDSIRPVGMFMILDYIWTRVRRDRRRRVLIVDEAWFMMKHPDSANFLHSIAKRGRKYYLGLTTITQDVEDFLTTDKGKAVVTNASIQMLFKQSVTAIDRLTEVFFLSEGERNLLLSANVGEGLFFAGESHVAMQVIASQEEHELVTTNPAELAAIERAKEQAEIGDEEVYATDDNEEYQFATSTDQIQEEEVQAETATAGGVELQEDTEAEAQQVLPPELSQPAVPQEQEQNTAQQFENDAPQAYQIDDTTVEQASPTELTADMLDQPAQAPVEQSPPEATGQIDTEEQPEGTIDPNVPNNPNIDGTTQNTGG